MVNVGEILLNLWSQSGFAALSAGFATGGWQNLVMIIIACVLLYLGIVKQFEPLLMVGIAFGCLLTNLPSAGLYHDELWQAFMDPASPMYHSYGATCVNYQNLFVYIHLHFPSEPRIRSSCLIFQSFGERST